MLSKLPSFRHFNLIFFIQYFVYNCSGVVDHVTCGIEHKLAYQSVQSICSRSKNVTGSVIKLRDLLKCQGVCASDPGCETFEYSWISQVCSPGGRLVDNSSTSLTSAPTNYDDSISPSTPDPGICGSSPCQNGGTCVDNVSSFTCDCLVGTTGSYCETNINDCIPYPCLNGGTCEDAINNYTCYCLIGYVGLQCEIIVTQHRSNDTFVTTQTTHCDPGFSLLSCGTANSQTQNVDKFRYIKPASAGTCECHDAYGAMCLAWCSNTVSGFQIVSSDPPQIGEFRANCPTGSFAVGCSLQSVGSTSTDPYDPYRKYFPAANGSSCICSDTVSGGTCYATCISNVLSYEVRSANSSGHFSVACKNGKSVLGCGIAPLGNGFEGFREAYVIKATACQCYDSFGCICYAICGNLV